MTYSKKDQIRALLKSIETGDPGPIAVVNQSRYIQHNPQTHEGSEGLESLFKRLSLTNPKVNVVRAFEDGDFFFGHTEYDFASRKIGFEVFRFEDGQVVEHWDNIQERLGPNPSGRSMVDGPVEVREPERTEANRDLVRAFVEEVLIGRQHDQLGGYFRDGRLIQHNPQMGDGVAALRAALEGGPGDQARWYDRYHRVLAEGDFVLAVIEGNMGGRHCSCYDLYRVEAGKLAEHWDTVEFVPPREVWKNDNGKF